jgi:predicted  nucleic acid-binding Zn-ribbon protein
VPERQNQEAELRRVLHVSREARLRSMQEKISIAATFCNTIEVEIRYRDLDRARELLRKVRSTLEDLTAHVSNPEHVSGERATEFQGQLARLRHRLSELDSLIDSQIH